MKKFLLACAWLLLLWSSTAMYQPTSVDQAIMDSVQPKVDDIIASNTEKAKNIATRIEAMLPQLDSSSRMYFILEWLHSYIMDNVNMMNTHSGDMMNDKMMDPNTTSFQSYMDYSVETFDAAVAAGLQVVINFRASRCPTCKLVSEEIIAHQDEIPDWVIVLEADYDATKTLQEKYGVKHQTTFTFFDTNWQLIKNVWLNKGLDQLLEEL